MLIPWRVSGKRCKCANHWFPPRPKAAIQKHSRGTSDATTKIGSQAPFFDLGWLWFPFARLPVGGS